MEITEHMYEIAKEIVKDYEGLGKELDEWREIREEFDSSKYYWRNTTGILPNFEEFKDWLRKKQIYHHGVIAELEKDENALNTLIAEFVVETLHRIIKMSKSIKD
jgi:cell fate (sporulation/competence/biofilm development) regulator YlbF (YheA/YmcA/DUF963 family)